MESPVSFPARMTREWLAFHGAYSWEVDDFHEAFPNGIDWSPESFDAVAAVVDMGHLAREILPDASLHAFNSSWLSLYRSHLERVKGDYASDVCTLSLAEFKSAVNAELKKIFFPS